MFVSLSSTFVFSFPSVDQDRWLPLAQPLGSLFLSKESSSSQLSPSASHRAIKLGFYLFLFIPPHPPMLEPSATSIGGNQAPPL